VSEAEIQVILIPNVTSFFLLAAVGDGYGVFEYAVQFEPAVDNERERFGLVQQLRPQMPNETMSFKFGRLLLPKILDNAKEGKAFELKTPEGKEIKLKLTFLWECPVGASDRQFLYNGLFSRIIKGMDFSELSKIGRRCYFNSKDKHPIPQHKLEVWPGYEIRVEDYEGGLHLNLDPATKVFRTETALDVITRCFRENSQNYKDVALRQLVGTSVITTYRVRSYKIDDIDFDQSPRSTFPDHSGKETSFVTYYSEKYGVKIGDQGQPMLISYVKLPKGPGGVEREPLRVTLVPELCICCGMTETQRQNFRAMEEVGKYTRLPPQTRREIVSSFLENIAQNADACKILGQWGIKPVKEALTLKARKLGPSTLMFGNGAQEPATKGDWARAAVSKPMLNTVSMKNWTIIFGPKDESAVKSITSLVQQNASRMGIQVREPNLVKMPSDRNEAFVGAVKDLPADTQISLAIFPGGTQRADRYAAVKKVCYLDRGMLNQCVTSKNATNEKRANTVVQKLLIQMQAKLGGEPWGIKVSQLQVLVLCPRR